MTGPKHPIQPLINDNQGKPHFKANAIVSFLLEAGPFTMNQIGVMPFSDEDREQFAQLIGSSLVGFGELPYVSTEAYDRAYLRGAALEISPSLETPQITLHVEVASDDDCEIVKEALRHLRELNPKAQFSVCEVTDHGTYESID